MPAAIRRQSRRSSRRQVNCGTCHEPGHNSRTCPQATAALGNLEFPEYLNTIRSNRSFGVEIEFIGSMASAARAVSRAGIPCNTQGYGHGVSRSWRVVTDGSVSAGGELVSPILSGSEGLRTAYRALKAMRTAGMSANRSCGLHVHVDMRNSTPQQRYAIAHRYGQLEAEIDRVVAPSRRSSENYFCCSNRGASMESLRHERYYKVNISAFERHGTVEFRHHQGTVNARKVCNWIKFCVNFVEETLSGGSGNIAAIEVPAVSNNVGHNQWPATEGRMTELVENLQNFPGMGLQRAARSMGLAPTTISTMVSRLRHVHGYRITSRLQGYRVLVLPENTTPSSVCARGGSHPVVELDGRRRLDQAPVLVARENDNPYIGLDAPTVGWFARRVTAFASRRGAAAERT